MEKKRYKALREAFEDRLGDAFEEEYNGSVFQALKDEATREDEMKHLPGDYELVEWVEEHGDAYGWTEEDVDRVRELKDKPYSDRTPEENEELREYQNKQEEFFDERGVKTDATTEVDRYFSGYSSIPNQADKIADYIHDRVEHADERPVTIHVLDMGSSYGVASMGFAAYIMDNIYMDKEDAPDAEMAERLADIDEDDVELEVVDVDFNEDVLGAYIHPTEESDEVKTQENPVRASGRKLPFQTDTFDIVISHNVLDGIPNETIQDEMREEMARVGKDEDLLYIRE